VANYSQQEYVQQQYDNTGQSKLETAKETTETKN
jgi:hypothetical protein